MDVRHTFEHGMHLRERVPSAARGTILWIHGLGESALCFEGVLRSSALAAWHHLAPDLPGYGKSPWLAAPLSLPGFAVHLAAWLTARAPRGPLVIAGHSMGGVIGTMLCEELARHGDTSHGDTSHGSAPRPVGFLNIEGNISPKDCGFSGRVARATVGDGTFQTQVIDNVFRHAGDDAPPEESDARAYRTYYPSLRLCDERAYLLNGRELVELSGEERLAARLAAPALPPKVLYLYGAPRGTGERSRELLDASGIEHRAIDGAGHWPFLDQPEEFLAQASAFLESFPA